MSQSLESAHQRVLQSTHCIPFLAWPRGLPGSQRLACGDDRSTGDTAGRDLRDHVKEG